MHRRWWLVVKAEAEAESESESEAAHNGKTHCSNLMIIAGRNMLFILYPTMGDRHGGRRLRRNVMRNVGAVALYKTVLYECCVCIPVG